eukprot:Tbor_TRINITY_DN5131_c0_g1::TRINITY_DN5131_c0_g1_i1::g.25874::m.25874/K00022/HADH; 3-hydroxyacyl-CoA dehydrogenase
MFRAISTKHFKHVAIWGGGTMGSGIAQITGASGYPCTIVELTEDRIALSKKSITSSLTRIATKKYPTDAEASKKYVEDVLKFISFTTDEMAAAGKADCIIEAIVENMAVKKGLWAKLDKWAQKDCIFASNTSSLGISEQAAVTTRPDRFGGLHFFSPVAMMKLVEIINTDKTSSETSERLKEFATKIGKTAVFAKDTKGFIVNRLLIPQILEACRLVEAGVATIEDVDIAMKLGAGHPMGPFTLADSVGIDVIKFICDAWNAEEPENPLFVPSKMIDDKCKEGKLGRKTGEGFYKYGK